MKTLLDREELVFNPPELGCVLYLPGLPGGGSKIYDRSPYGNQGTITGASWKRLPSGLWCLSFDGQDDYVDCGTGNSLNLGVGNFSIELWLKATTLGAKKILSKYQDDDNRWYLQIDSSGFLHMFCKAGGVANVVSISNGVDLTDGIWHHAVIVGDRGNRGWAYVDGIDATGENQACLTNDMDNTGNFYLARYTTIYYNHQSALIRIYKKILSSLEIQNHFNREKCLFGVWSR